ncbi:hypothetical protein ACFC8N_42510 [Streptomyces sp. NPDC055966]|uniref:hypothetical protein n=1 Tax=Streptomyces sp. NPDC055966 TaxID=3345669 RepID=UPI0035D6CD44
MAASLISPIVPFNEISLGDASALFAETDHPIAVRTLQRQCKARGVPLTRHGRADHASWTDLLKVHAAWVDGR